MPKNTNLSKLVILNKIFVSQLNFTMYNRAPFRVYNLGLSLIRGLLWGQGPAYQLTPLTTALIHFKPKLYTLN